MITTTSHAARFILVFVISRSIRHYCKRASNLCWVFKWEICGRPAVATCRASGAGELITTILSVCSMRYSREDGWFCRSFVFLLALFFSCCSVTLLFSHRVDFFSFCVGWWNLLRHASSLTWPLSNSNSWQTATTWNRLQQRWQRST